MTNKTIPFKFWLNPVQDKLIVRHYAKQPKSDLLIIEDKEDAPMTFGVVEAVGPRVEVVEVGDNIVFKSHIGSYVQRFGKEYTVLAETEVEAITMRDGLR